MRFSDDWYIKLAEHISAKNVLETCHETLPLRLYNYSQSCQFDGNWDDVTLKCRGLVLDNGGNIVAYPLEKFFNIEEKPNVPSTPFDVYDKLDGSCLIGFRYENSNIFCTRGSFVSEQAIEGGKMWDKLYTGYELDAGYTYVFELIYPSNRIVVDYGNRRELVLLAIRKELSELHLSDEYVQGFVSATGVSISDTIRVESLSDLLNYEYRNRFMGEDREGVVVRFENGYRVKIKFTDYCLKHAIITNVTERNVWKALQSQTEMDRILSFMPDEIYDWFRCVEDRLKREYVAIVDDAKAHFNIVINDLPASMRGDKARFAMAVNKYISSQTNLKHQKSLNGLLFALYDSGEVKPKTVWKLIKPRATKPCIKSVSKISSDSKHNSTK